MGICPVQNFPAACHHGSDSVIGPPRVMVEKEQFSHSRFGYQPGDRVYVRMAPASPDIHFLRKVLAVVDQHIRAATKIYEFLEARSGPRVFHQFIIREENECAGVFPEAEAQASLWVLELVGSDESVVKGEMIPPGPLGRLDARLQVLKSDGPCAVNIIGAEDSFEALYASPEPIHHDVARFPEKGPEKGKAHNMVPVYVCYQHMHIQGAVALQQ